jgi:hypothetical protein
MADAPAPTPVDRRGMAILAVVPFVVLAGVLKQLPDAVTGAPLQPWPHAAVHSIILLGLMVAHAACYRLWVPHAPNRMLVNEFLTRSWFVLFGLVLIGMHGDMGPIFLLLAAPWAVASWCTHYLILRRQRCYRVLENIAILGLFLLGLALMGLLCIRGLDG